jgi:O-acetyl-ADP-ribose deacetylase (regulator of RNase III)
MDVTIRNRRLRLIQGDITRVPSDAIVNAANADLIGGGGVDGAIHRVGGIKISQELEAIRKRIGRCPTGKAVVTAAGDLPAHFVFHAVGPIYRQDNREQAELLGSCYETCLQLATERGARIISFPSISTGAYGYPVEEAASIAIRTVAAFLANASGGPSHVVFVLFDAETLDAYSEALREWLRINEPTGAAGLQ